LKVRPRPSINFAEPYWVSQFERFVVQMAEAFDDERAGTGVVCFSDETFVHLLHSGWQTVVDGDAEDQIITPRKSSDRASVPTGGPKGQLVIIVHAITRDGWLCDTNDDGTPWRQSLASTVEQGGFK